MSKYIESDVILVGAGIMSATLGTLLKELAPNWDITIFEALKRAGEESSHELNNAGTGHAGLCELNYVKEKKDGTMNIDKAIEVNEQFQQSLQFWSFLVRKKAIPNPRDFIHPLPHISLVKGEESVRFLQKRYEAMKKHPLFHNMEFATDEATFKKWFPLIMKDRTSKVPMAATRIETGTDVNFGALTRILISFLQKQGANVLYEHRVKDLKKLTDGKWEVKVVNSQTGELILYRAKFVFLGAGGGALPLLQKSGIPESKHIGGFPISGVFLVCNNQEVINMHNAKVYGKASVGTPPMSVPHLDTRYIDGKKSLLFGPFAGFSPKFLKAGSNLDLFTSIKTHNLFTMISCGLKTFDLSSYLVKQLLMSKEKKIEELREFVPSAKPEDWEVITAGQRVQVIKDTPNEKGVLQFGTEVITSQDGTISALLGASPGASTAVNVMLKVIERCFPTMLNEWESKIKEMVPSYKMRLSENLELLKEIKETTKEQLQL